MNILEISKSSSAKTEFSFFFGIFSVGFRFFQYRRRFRFFLKYRDIGFGFRLPTRLYRTPGRGGKSASFIYHRKERRVPPAEECLQKKECLIVHHPPSTLSIYPFHLSPSSIFFLYLHLPKERAPKSIIHSNCSPPLLRLRFTSGKPPFDRPHDLP